MSDLGQVACVFLSFTGGIYCLWTLWDCRKQAQAWQEPGEPGTLPTRRNAISKRIEWLCQFLFAGTFLVIALVVLSGSAYRVLAHAAESRTDGRQQASPIEMVSAQQFPAIYLHRDSAQLGRPIVGIDCGTEPISDQQLRNLLCEAPNLDWLILTSSLISDDSLRDLSHCPHLRALNLTYTQITDDGLKHLAELKNLEALTVEGTEFTDDGLRNLAEQRNLKALRLYNTAITDGGLEHLCRLDQLRSLYLGKNKRVTREGSERLAHTLPHVNVDYWK